MAQLQKGFEYDSSNPVKNIVTDDNLNALVANATLLSGAITEQTANSITADSDIMVLSKAGGLIKQTKGQFTDTINSNIVNVNTVNSSLVDTDDIDTVDATLTGNLVVGGNSALTGNLAITGNISGNLAVTGLVTASTVPTTGGHLTNKTYVDGLVSKTTNGYVKLPNGLIMEWGEVAIGSYNTEAGFDLTFPLAFPTSCLNVTATIWNDLTGGTGTEDNFVTIGKITSTTVRLTSGSTVGGSRTYGIKWFAIGH